MLSQLATKTPWKKYFADDCMFFDERGRSMNKAALLADLSPTPKGYSGNIAIENAKSHIEDDVAILGYDLDEKESIFGQNLTARYHENRYVDAPQWKLANHGRSGVALLRRPGARKG